MKTVLITGGSGLVGKRLTGLLAAKGYRVIILSRNPASHHGGENISYAAWDIRKRTIDAEAIQSADYIVHLAGAGVVARRWSEAYKKEIVFSRTESSRLIIETLQKHPNKVKAIISSSAIGWYGPDKVPGKFFTETDTPADDFLGTTCVSWEESISMPENNNLRVCMLRTGIVLANEGGALAEFRKPVKLGIAAILGTGNQMVSWIHIDDLCRMYLFAIENETMSGSYNAVANVPVSNKELTLKIAWSMKGKFFIPLHVPAFMLKLILGESSIEVLKSATVSNAKAREAGFTFLYPSIDAALLDLSVKGSQV